MVITTIGKSGTALVLAGQGTAPNYMALGNGINFDGSNELRVEITWEIIQKNVYGN